MRTKKTIYNVISSLILQFVIVIYGFIVPKIIISNFGSSVNGLVSSITQFLGYIVLLESGFGPVVKAVLYKPIANKDKNQIINILKSAESFFRKIAYIFLVYIFILIFVYPFIINNQFDIIYTGSLIVIIAISTFAEYFFGMTYRIFLQADQKNYIISIVQILLYILSILIIILLVSINSSIHIIKFASGIIFITKPIILNLYVKKKYKINLKNTSGNYNIEQKWDGIGQHIAGVIHTNTDITILTIFTKLTEVSVYSVYLMIVKGIDSIMQSFTNGIDSIFGNMMAKSENVIFKDRFSIYETIYFTICTIIYSCTMILIVPFVLVYTKNIFDVDYIRNVFGYLIVISEFIWAIRQPYHDLVKAAGHFKQTSKGAYLEAFINVFISIVLVIKYGIIGVVIGTIIAMTIRTIELIVYTNKNIINKDVMSSVKKIAIVILETIIIVFVCNYLPIKINLNLYSWILYSLLILSISCATTLLINIILFKNDFIKTYKIFKLMVCSKIINKEVK